MIFFDPHRSDGVRLQGKTVNTLTSYMGTGGNNVTMVAYSLLFLKDLSQTEQPRPRYFFLNCRRSNIFFHSFPIFFQLDSRRGYFTFYFSSKTFLKQNNPGQEFFSELSTFNQFFIPFLFYFFQLDSRRVE